MTALSRHPSAQRHLTRLCAVLLCTLAALAPFPRVALAAQGTVTVNSADNADATYDAYQVFAADVTSDGVATHISWVTDDLRSAILAFLDENGYGDWLSETRPEEGQHDIAQNAAEYICAMIEASPTDTDADTQPRTTVGPSFANGLAQAIAASGMAPVAVQAGQAFTAEQGFWLLVTAAGTTDATDEAGTAPIWIALGPDGSEVTEKTAVPTIDKQVLEDSTQSWGTTADANRNQDLEFCLTGTLPQNFAAYTHFHYRFVDKFSKGIAPTVGAGGLSEAIEVSIDGNVVTPDDANLMVGYDQDTLFVDFVDLKGEHWTGCGISAQSTIIVRYRAHLTQAAVVGNQGNPNEAYLVYTNDPVSESDGQTNTVVNKVFSYGLDIEKLAKDGDMPLPGAEFTLREQDGSHLYVQQDGSLSETPFTFKSDEKGHISTSCLDEGSYVLAETKAPEGYRTLPSDLTIRITSQMGDAEPALARLSVEASSDEAKVRSVEASTGVASLAIYDEPAAPQGVERLAQTGGGPLAAVLAGTGLTLLTASRLRGGSSRRQRYRRRH